MIRPISPDDKDIFIKLASEFYSSDAVSHSIPHEHHLRTFEELIRSNVYAEAFIFETGKNAAGYALLAKTFSQEAGGITIWIEELYILPEYRSHGIGHAFFEYLFDRYGSIARFRLEVEKTNTGAISLYKELGFESFPYQQMVLDI